MQAPIYRGEDVALFIDWENFKISLAVGHRTPNVSALKEEVSNHGRVVVAKAYADWVTRAPELRGASQFINDPPSLYAAGIEPVYVPTRAPAANASFANGVRTTRIKNSVDVKMTADCIECAHSYPNINTFVLVSGDSDFIHVVNALRTMGKHVLVVGVSWSTSRRLSDQVDELILYDVDVDPVVPLEPTPIVIPPAAAIQAPPGKPDLAEIISAIEEIIRDERKAGGNPLLTSIKQRMVRRYPNFDEKKLGFSGFKKLMARAAQEGNIKLITAGLVDWAIMADEETPEGATEESPSGIAARPSRRRGGRYSRSRHPSGSFAETGYAPDAPPTDLDEGVLLLDEPALLDEPDLNDQQYDDPASEDISGGVSGDFRPDEPAEVPAPFGGDMELANAVREAVGQLSMPAKPDDGLMAERVADLIIMADYLEHQEGVSHVAFNFLVEQICENLGRGISEGAAQITAHWSDASSRTYVSKVLRSLSDAEFFEKGSHNWRDETTNQSKRRRTFNLNRKHPLVQRVLTSKWGHLPDPETNGHSLGQPGFEEPNFDQPVLGQTNFGQLDPDDSAMDDDDQNEAALVGMETPAEPPAETSFISRLFRPLRN